MPDEVSTERFETLKQRVYGLADQVRDVMIEHGRIGGRIESAEQSIDRLIKTSATSDQVISSSTILSLKLDHLLEKQFDMKRQISFASRVFMLVFVGGVLALMWVALK